MKKIVSILCTVGLIFATTGCIWAQGSAPSSPSPLITSGTTTYNRTPGSFLWRTNTSGVWDSLYFARTGGISYIYPQVTNAWRLGTASKHFGMGWIDTAWVKTIVLNAGALTGFFGSRMVADPSGNLSVSFATSPLTASEMQSQTITKFQMDTTQSFVGAHFYKTGTDTLTELVTKRYADSTENGKAFPTWNSTWNDGYFKKWDSVNQKFVMAAGTGSGDVVNIATVAHTTNPTLSFTGATVTKSNDTVTIAVAGTNAVNRNGDTLTGTHSWAYGGSGSLSGLDTIRTKKLQASDSIGAPKVWTDILQGRTNTDLSIYPFSTAKWLQLKTDTVTTGSTTARWYIAKDSITNSNAGSAIISKMATHDSVKIGGTWFSNGSFTDATHGNTGIATKKNVRDTLNAELANYVAKLNENWQKSGSGPILWSLINGLANDTAVKITRTSGATYTTAISPQNGNITISSGTASGNKVTIQGPTTGNPKVSIGANTNLNNFALDSVSRADFDTATVDKVLRIQSDSSNATNFTAIKSGATTPYTLTLPTTLGSGGVLTFDASGVGTFGAGGGGGGNPIMVNATVADSIQMTASSSITPTLTKATGFDGLTFAVTGGLSPSLFTARDSIATRKEIADSLGMFRTTRQPFGTGAFTVTPADSIFAYSATRNTKMLSIKGSFTGGDTVTIAPYTGYGMNIGGTGVTYLGGDSTIASLNHGKIVYGLNSTSATFNWLDSIRVDSLRRGLTINRDSAFAIAPSTILGKGAITAADSTWLTLGREDAGQTYLFVDSTSDASTVPIRDSCAAQFIMPYAFQLDSFKFMYKVANTADSIGNVLLYGPKTGNMYADSIYMTNTNQQLHATSLAEKSYAKSATFRAGQEVKVRFTNYLSAQSRYVKVVYVTLWGRKRS